MGSPISLSVTIITLNEERNIGRCLDSVAPIADEIVVVDSASSDRTQEICRARSVRLIEQEFLGYAQQKNFATDQASYRHILSLDADECLSPDLAKLILEIKHDWTADGYTMNRHNNYYGHWMRHGSLYPDRKLRLWNRDKGRWQGTHVHEKVIMQSGAVVKHLGADLQHYAYDSIEAHVHQANRFSSLAARAYHDLGKGSTLAGLLARPVLRLCRDYFLRRGFLDGFPGFAACVINAHMTFLKYAKQRELQKLLDSKHRGP